MIQFFICNIFICAIIGILLAVKYLFKNCLTSRMQYHLWFVLLLLLAIPFIPVRPIGHLHFFSWLNGFTSTTAENAGAVIDAASHNSSTASILQNDFSISVSRETTSIIGKILCFIWVAGIVAMLVRMVKSRIRLNTLKRSSLPLQNMKVRKLYNQCLDEMHIRKEIPVCSTTFLKSPVIVGIFKPCIYLPIHLISDYNATDMRYMLLHELQHYKHKDALVNYLMNLAGVLYWFNPFVWHALREMRSDREVACDTSVLKMLGEDEYEDYGNTLINLAEKVSLAPFPFAAGISGNAKQMRKRIMNIASYERPSFLKRFRGITVFCVIALLLLSLTPALSTYAADENRYQWNTSSKNITYIDLSAYFEAYNGSFVLYDLGNDSWNIYDMEQAVLRVAPNSTYKIYDALFGLEERVIAPKDSLLTWNKQSYPFTEWNADQDLSSAMHSSVNWYFQEIDAQLGAACISEYIQEIGYGNEDISGDFSTYWLESSLKISAIEQVELLTKLYNNDYGFAPENINAVKDSIRLSSSETGAFYGKTGTGRINGQDVNGWFVGYVETVDNAYFFATNITADDNAAGSNAAEITTSVLLDMNILK